MWVHSLGCEDPLEEGMATHSSILPWSIPWRGSWQTIVHGVSKSRTGLKQLNSKYTFQVGHTGVLRKTEGRKKKKTVIGGLGKVCVLF